MNELLLMTSLVHFSSADAYAARLLDRQMRRFERWTPADQRDDPSVRKHFQTGLPWVERFPCHRYNDIVGFIETAFDGGTRIRSDWFGAYSPTTQSEPRNWGNAIYRKPSRSLQSRAFRHVPGHCAEVVLPNGVRSTTPEVRAALLRVADFLDAWAAGNNWVTENDHLLIECVDWASFLARGYQR